MMTQNFSFSRILPVWLVLFAFLCGMILPSDAIARMEMAIAMEGDPTDGLDSSGGGGGGSGNDGIDTAPPIIPAPPIVGIFSEVYFDYLVIFPIYENGKLVIKIFLSPEIGCPRGNFK